jgi:hypothetical protein
MADVVRLLIDGVEVSVPVGMTVAVALAWRATRAGLRHGHLLRVPSVDRWPAGHAVVHGHLR